MPSCCASKRAASVRGISTIALPCRRVISFVDMALSNSDAPGGQSMSVAVRGKGTRHGFEILADLLDKRVLRRVDQDFNLLRSSAMRAHYTTKLTEEMTKWDSAECEWARVRVNDRVK